MSYKILYKFATRSRPDRFLKCLDNMEAMMRHDDYEIHVTADRNDESMNADGVVNRVHTYNNSFIIYGESTDKVNAINRDMEVVQGWDILINMSDDMEFIVPGFDLQIINDFKLHNTLDLLIHYPDQAAGQALITMAIMGKDYYNRFGYIYNPEYKSLFCDNEQQEVAKRLGRYVFIKKRLFNHNHPAWGLAQADDLMRHTESFYYEDQATFERRKLVNFGV